MSRIKELQNLLLDAETEIAELKKLLSNYDKEVNAIYHEIEQTNFSASQGYYYAKRLQYVLSKRRIIKHRIRDNEFILGAIRGLKGNAADIINQISKRIAKQKKNTSDDMEYLALTRINETDFLVNQIKSDYEEILGKV